MSEHMLARGDDLRPWIPRAGVLSLVTLLCLGNWSRAVGADDFQTTVVPFLKRHCYICHGPHKQEFGIRFDQIDGFYVKDRHLWTMVHEMVASDKMPPIDRAPPNEDEKKKVLTWIENAQRALDPGGTRRLNRREISGALRDLTGLSVDYAHALPGDGKVEGFDTGAEGLRDAAPSVAQMMDVTRRAVDGIRFLEPAKGKVFSADLREVKDARRALDDWKKEGATPKTRGHAKPGLGLLIETKWVGERGGTSITIPTPENGQGVLRLKLVVSAKKYFSEVPNPHLWVEVGGKDIDYREITATAEEPLVLVYEIQLEDLAIEPKGVTIDLVGRVEIPYGVKGFENEDKTKPEDKIPGGPGLFRPAYNRKGPAEEQPIPFVVLHQIEVEPNYVKAWPPENWQADIGKITDHPVRSRSRPAKATSQGSKRLVRRASAEESASWLLQLWMERAWRRPVTNAEQEPFLSLYHNLRDQGMSFDNALRATFQSVLLSGPFRYLTTPAQSDPARSQQAIASRLSFMLISAPPDEELRQLAAAGKLREPAVLDAQVDRLLADPRSDHFIRPFVTQWLEMDQPITLTMDYFKKQDFRFGRFLKASMREETIRYVAELFQENKPARELIISDWTMMNNALARHYGYDGIEGGHLRKVKLRADDPRGGGILSHAGIQSMLCWMGDNWVIYRGAWTLRHILDDPPPPPPLEVPELDPSAGENRGKSFKELLRLHQADTKCAVCHRSIDPLGFAFQNFDISGRWRDLEYERYVRNELDGKIEWRGVGKTRPVDTVGRLPRGEEFQSYSECKELIVNHYLTDIVRGLLKNLMIYATSRKPDIDDLAEIRAIMKQHASNGYRMRDLIKAVIRSRAFLEH